MKLFLLSSIGAKNCIVKRAAHHSFQKRVTDLDTATKNRERIMTLPESPLL